MADKFRHLKTTNQVKVDIETRSERVVIYEFNGISNSRLSTLQEESKRLAKKLGLASIGPKDIAQIYKAITEIEKLISEDSDKEEGWLEEISNLAAQINTILESSHGRLTITLFKKLEKVRAKLAKSINSQKIENPEIESRVNNDIASIQTRILELDGYDMSKINQVYIESLYDDYLSLKMLALQYFGIKDGAQIPGDNQILQQIVELESHVGRYLKKVYDGDIAEKVEDNQKITDYLVQNIDLENLDSVDAIAADLLSGELGIWEGGSKAYIIQNVESLLDDLLDGLGEESKIGKIRVLLFVIAGKSTTTSEIRKSKTILSDQEYIQDRSFENQLSSYFGNSQLLFSDASPIAVTIDGLVRLAHEKKNQFDEGKITHQHFRNIRRDEISRIAKIESEIIKKLDNYRYFNKGSNRRVKIELRKVLKKINHVMKTLH